MLIVNLSNSIIIGMIMMVLIFHIFSLCVYRLILAWPRCI